MRHAIFLDGPIGAGKTTYGKRLAKRMAGKFLEGDDYTVPGVPWYASSLSTSRKIVAAGLQELATRRLVLIAYPIRCLNWIYFRRRFEAAGIAPLFVGLQASPESLVDGSRLRRLSAEEHARSLEMIEQGYGARPFHDHALRTDSAPIETVTDALDAAIRGLMSGKD